MIKFKSFRDVAQLVGRQFWELDAAGSSPVIPTMGLVQPHGCTTYLAGAISSVGRALRSQRRGRGFESLIVHHKVATKNIATENPDRIGVFVVLGGDFSRVRFVDVS